MDSLADNNIHDKLVENVDGVVSSDFINNTDFTKWLQGIPYEVAFWRSYYGNKTRRKDLFDWSMFNKPCVLDDFEIDAYIANCGSTDPRILDVGCALSYAFGNIINGKPANVGYVDPLAPFYNHILKRYKIDRPSITFGMIESLSASFDESSIDFIHVRNALDHCANPLLGIIQCLITLKIGGVLYLNHFENEAKNEGYRGFHQFNIFCEDNQLILWNKSIRINVTDFCKDFATVKTSITDAGRIVSVITKTAEIPADLDNPERSAKNMAEMMISTVEYFHSLNNSLNYQLKRLVSTLGHRTMRVLPWSILNKIKRLAGK